MLLSLYITDRVQHRVARALVSHRRIHAASLVLGLPKNTRDVDDFHSRDRWGRAISTRSEF